MLRFPLVLVLTAVCAVAVRADVIPLPRAHSHNDYYQERPLLDALEHGVCSVEADVFLVDGELLVAHDAHELTPERSLQALYLDPLLERVRENGGRVLPDGPVFTLLVDFKTSGREAYPVLKALLENYREMLCEYTNDSTEERAVAVILSGSRPIREVEADEPRLCALDGRIPDLRRNPNPHLYPLISASWMSVFDWTGAGKMPAEERAQLDAWVKQAHDNGQRIRFWALPFSLDVWDVAYESGVDLINVDFMDKIQKFLLEKRGLAETTP